METKVVAVNIQNMDVVPMVTLQQLVLTTRDVPVIHSNLDAVRMVSALRQDLTNKVVGAVVLNLVVVLMTKHLPKELIIMVATVHLPNLVVALMGELMQKEKTLKDVKIFLKTNKRLVLSKNPEVRAATTLLNGTSTWNTAVVRAFGMVDATVIRIVS